MSDKLDKYGKKYYPPLGKPTVPKLVTPKLEYEAFTKAKGAERIESLKVYDKNGNFSFHSYSHLMEGNFYEGTLTLTMASRIYTLTGKNLDQLAELMSEKKIKAIREFNADKYQLPQDTKRVVIETITEED